MKKSIHIHTLGCVAAGMILTVTPAFAALVYYNGAPNQFAATSDASAGGESISADNFTLAGSATIANITWSGLYRSANTPTEPDNFTIVFYEDSTGLPGATLGSYTPGNNVNRLDSGNDGFGDDIYNYSANITPLNLAAGDFWISIFNNTAADTDDNWNWSYSAPIDASNEAARRRPNLPTTWVSTDIEYSFALNDTPAVVPLPAAAWLMGSGLLALFGFSRRRAARA